MNTLLEVEVGEALRRLRWTLATAESCTGGLVGHLITQVAGSSDYFRGGVVAYANEGKHRVLGVRADTLEQHGAVSRETALEMARGARTLLEADIAVSVTGIAGPGGGSPDKPVGTTWIAVSCRNAETAEHFVWQGDRQAVKAQSAQAALRLLLQVLESCP